MKVIVDANIVFSGILNTNGKIGDLLLNSNGYFDFIAPDFLRTEIRNHYPKLCKISKMGVEEVKEPEYQITKSVTFISEEQIPISIWEWASELMANIDPKDTHYVAYSKYFKCKIWTGDKVLIKGVKAKGFKNVVTTEELYEIREAKGVRRK